MIRQLAFAVFVVVGADLAPTSAQATRPVDLGTRRELFIDRLLVDKLSGTARLRMHTPRDEGSVLTFDEPWEGPFTGYFVVMSEDGGKFRMYYRGLPDAKREADAQVICYAESEDGIRWTKPALGLFPRDGRPTNIVRAGEEWHSGNFAPFIDRRPGVPAAERYKSLSGGWKTALYAYASPDGIRWRKLRDDPVMRVKDVPFRNPFDSSNVAFWSESEGKYVGYIRVLHEKVRRVARIESDDFLRWSTPALMGYRRADGSAAPVEEMYTNQTAPYPRAPHLYVATAARFIYGRRALDDAQVKTIGVDPKFANDLSDVALLTTRGGAVYDRTFMEAFIPPGIGAGNWVSRTNYPAWQVVQTGPAEMSLYVNQNYAQPTAHLRRYSLRLDGFASVRADYDGGELLTPPLTFVGSRLLLNFATSAAGGIRAEVIDAASGTPMHGFGLADCEELIGNEIERSVTWKGGDLNGAAGKVVRLRFLLKDADLFAIRFAQAP